ncbi:MAG TPA: hypothetical protein VGG72_32140 [Bryobacteraceae bacterium]|jgi:hypothetical protein
MPKQKLLNVLFAVAALIAAMALATLVPFSSGNIKSDLGYMSLCPFAPWSTLTLLAFAGLVWLFRAYLKTQSGPPR